MIWQSQFEMVLNQRTEKKGGELNIYFTLHTKINSKSKKKLRARTVSSKLLEENMGINLQKVKIFKN